MELMDINLKNYLLENDPEIKEKSLIIQNILNGVEYLHDNKIIHCDLKPDNILINYNQILDVKIADFGLVIKKDNKKSVNKDHGTIIYMPPENEYSFKYDIYSLGIIFFEIISSFKTLMEKYIEIENFKNKTYNNHLISKMISFNPDDRPTIKEINVSLIL